MSVDIGSYNADPERYQQLVDEMYRDHPPITLPPEYAYFFEKDLIRLFLRLARYKFVARHVRKTDRVLEVGCGSGVGCMLLSQNCAHVTGLDVKSTELEEARSMNRRPNVEFRQQDLFDVAEEASYDAVVALDVIEHMPEAQGEQLLRGMARLLKPTGIAVIGTPSIYSYPYQSSFSQASHVKCYDRDELVGVMERVFARTLAFSMNDEMVHTGHPKMAWYYFVIAMMPKA